jgi:hypothetical protein
MNKKLTLNVDESLIDFAHEYAQRTKQSVSSLIEKYLTRLQEDIDTKSIAPEAQELYGILKKEGIPDKESIRKKFYEKSSH